MLVVGPIQGVSPLEISHRSSEFHRLKQLCEDRIRQLLHIPNTFRVLWITAPASSMFSSIPLYLYTGKQAYYRITGKWSEKAHKEAQKYLQTHTQTHTQTHYTMTNQYSYKYYCSN